MSNQNPKPKVPSRWDALGESLAHDESSRNYNRRGNRPNRPNIGTLIEQEEKWVNNKPTKKYTKMPDSNSTIHFPAIGAAEASGPAETGADYGALTFTEDPSTMDTLPDTENGMVNLRNYKNREPEEEYDQDTSYNMYWAIEEMKARWYDHNERQGIFVDYDHVPDKLGIDSWASESESECSESEDEYDNY